MSKSKESRPDHMAVPVSYRHQHKITGRGQYNVTDATSAAANHLKQRIRSHEYNEQGIIEGPSTRGGQLSVIQSLQFQGVNVPQRVANEFEGFDGQVFRDIAVNRVVENNHPLREVETEAFRAMIKLANPRVPCRSGSVQESRISETAYYEPVQGPFSVCEAESRQLHRKITLYF
jgi:hypothetical protein